MSKTGDLSNLRKEYLQSGIIRENLNDSPVEQFSLWFSQAMDANIIEPSAMSLATSDDTCLLYTSPSPRDRTRSRMPSSA